MSDAANIDLPADRRRRARMLRDQLQECGDARVLAAMAELPRHAFVPAELRAEAYGDHALAIGADQTISQPRVVAAMLAALAPQAGARALDVGCGSGYVAALLARLVHPGGRVRAIERQVSLVARAQVVLELLCGPQHAACSVELRHEDASGEGADTEPYDVIHVACAASAVPPALFGRLAPGGRLVAPVGPADEQRLLLWTRRDDGALEHRELMAVRFVPMLPGLTQA